MQKSGDDAPAKDGAAEAAYKACPGCGGMFAPGGRGLGKTFCSPPCRRSFQNRMIAEGAPLVALVKAWAMTRHARPGTREAEICTFARGQITQIASAFNERDADEGRPSAADYVETLMKSGTLWCDRRRG